MELGHRREEEEEAVENLKKQRLGEVEVEQVAGVVEAEALHHHHHLCWVEKGQEEVGNPWSAVGQVVVGEDKGCVWGPWVRCERV